MRFFFEISYDGTPFYGWQKQIGQISVQEVLETELQKVFQHEKIEIVGCGRTDRGVHAKQYFFHVDLISDIKPTTLIFKLNRMLPESISVQSIFPVNQDLHARYSATKRTYRYFIHQTKNPFLVNYSTYFPLDLNFNEMDKSIEYLIGTKDFSSFAKTHTDVKTHICTIHEAKWVKTDEQIYFEITADRFLRNMVRAIVGTLLDVGLGKIEPVKLKRIIKSENRGAASKSVSANGLFLWKVEYDFK